MVKAPANKPTVVTTKTTVKPSVKKTSDGSMNATKNITAAAKRKTAAVPIVAAAVSAAGHVVSFYSKSSVKSQPLLGVADLDAKNWRAELSNFSTAEPLKISGSTYASGEHYFHAAKYVASTKPALSSMFTTAGSVAKDPAAAKRAGGRKGMEARGASLDVAMWNASRIAVQEAIHAARCEQHRDYNRIIAAVSAKGWTLLHFERDGPKSYWGGSVAVATGAVCGQNMLGRIMQGRHR
jgi:predicted NAD-dependent protein-ADP-ribosyltransferase YbiA (DUF1768 family)